WKQKFSQSNRERHGSSEHHTQVSVHQKGARTSANLQVQLRPLVSGLRNAMRSGEGLVYAISGHGQVFFTPTHRRISIASLGE
ncbi:hypothetical protein ACVWZX_002597, partial [Deinococcus sp. UYEF24]